MLIESNYQIVKKKTLIKSVILIMFVFPIFVVAQQQEPPPPSGLGQQILESPPQIVYPHPSEIVEETIQDIENIQLTPDQFDRLKNIYLERERQKAIPYISPAKPITRTLFINLDPGINPPVLRLSRGQQTSIVFSDMSGQPWFIESVSMNNQLFSNSRQGQQQPTNVLSLEPNSPTAYGNITIMLRGLFTPVIFVLTSAQQEVDMRVDAKVLGHNPDSIEHIEVSTLPSIDDAFSYFLDGIPPNEAKNLKVTGLEGTQAWIYHNNLYVRVRADAQYPAYIAAARSTSGVSVYRYANLHNSVTFTKGGKAITVFIE